LSTRSPFDLMAALATCFQSQSNDNSLERGNKSRESLKVNPIRSGQLVLLIQGQKEDSSHW